MLYLNRPQEDIQNQKILFAWKKIKSEIKSLPTMKPTDFANQFFQKSREETIISQELSG